MKQTVSLIDFRCAFIGAKLGEYFSEDGLEALFEHLEVYDPNTPLNVADLCLQYVENTHDDIRKKYKLEDMNDMDIVEWLRCEGAMLIYTDAYTVLYSNFD